MVGKKNQKEDLQQLNLVLQKERAAIIHLNMSLLQEIHQEKNTLLARIKANECTPSDEEQELIRKIKINIRHNRHILLSGLRAIARQQKYLYDLSAMTYGIDAIPAVYRSIPKMMARSA